MEFSCCFCISFFQQNQEITILYTPIATLSVVETSYESLCREVYQIFSKVGGELQWERKLASFMPTDRRNSVIDELPSASYIKSEQQAKLHKDELCKGWLKFMSAENSLHDFCFRRKKS